jgi:hypothetical protein
MRASDCCNDQGTQLGRGLAYGDLVPINARTNISVLERGKFNITVDKLIELSTPLKLAPVALLAISISMSNGGEL